MRVPVRPFAVATALAVIASAGSVRGQGVPVHQLRHDAALDATIAASGAVFWFGTELLKPSLAPATCRWCDRDPNGTDTLNSVDASVRSSLRWSNSSSAAGISDVIGMALVPVAAVGLDALASHHDRGSWQRAGVDAIIIAEAAFVATAINQTVKLAVGRERPFVHARPPDQNLAVVHSPDDNLSFFSQHTTWTFALATSSGTVASMRGYRLAPLVWSVGMPLAAMTGYLRIAADRHYLTDVAVGALFGAAVGVALPMLAHGRQGSDAGAAAMGTASSPIMVAVAGVF
jgi:membrane-associated phospholipid phosphatase